MTKKHNLIVLSAAVIISSGIWIFTLAGKEKERDAYSTKVFEGANGWGYDILVNDTLFIHQEYMPVVIGQKGFEKKEQAEKTAQLIINKMKRGQHPTVTTFELQQIISVNKNKYGRIENSE